VVDLIDSQLDPALQAAITSANNRISFTTQRDTLKIRLQQDLMYFIEGGTFKITPELISFVYIMKSAGSIVLIDLNDNPIKINDIEQFYDGLVTKYFEVTNQYLFDLAKLKKSRAK